MVITQLTHSAQEVRRDFPNTAFTLDGFKRDRCRLRSKDSLERIQIVRRHLIETRCLRAKSFQILGLATRSDGPKGPTMERALEGYDVKALRLTFVEVVPARALDGSFHRFGAGIHKKHLVGKGSIAKALRKALTFGYLMQVGYVPEFGSLLLQRGYEVRMAMPYGIDGNTGTAIEESSAVFRDKPDTFPMIKRQVRSCVVTE